MMILNDLMPGGQLACPYCHQEISPFQDELDEHALACDHRPQSLLEGWQGIRSVEQMGPQIDQQERLATVLDST